MLTRAFWFSGGQALRRYSGQALRRWASTEFSRTSSGQALRRYSGQALRRWASTEFSRTSSGQALRRYSGQALRRCSGQATLSFILLVSGVVVEVAVAGSFVAYFLNTAGFGERLAARALAAAESGVDDVALQVVRNKEFVTGDSYDYAFPVGSDTVSVSVSRATDGVTGNYIYTVTATGVAGSRERRLVARIAVNQTTGLAMLQTVGEQPVD
ncbi:MAG: hypothetical protein V1696_02655 [Candidatus Jorgensenbacteria bacterium]